MDALLVATVFGLGVVFVFDALVRPNVQVNPLARLKRVGPAGASAVIASLAAGLATTWPVAMIASAALGASVPGTLRRSRFERVGLARREAIAEVASRLRDAIRSGIGLADALAQASTSAPGAIAADLRRLVAESRVSGIAEAAESFAARVDDPAAELFASALGFAERLGSRNLSDVLDSLAEATTAQAATIREARARQTRARMSARIVAAVPMLLLVAIRRANPAYLAPFSTPGGQAVLGFAFVLVWIGYQSMKRAARLEGGAA